MQEALYNMSRYATTKKSSVQENQSLAAAPKSNAAIVNLVYKSREKLKRIPLAKRTTTKTAKKFPVLYRNNTKNIVTASHMLAHKYPTGYMPENYKKAINELQYVIKGMGIFLLLVYIGWAALTATNFLQGGNFVYNTGLIGGILMLVALVYYALKRIRFLRRFVGTDVWYFLHIGTGAAGSYLVVLHTSFNLTSINSTVAFVTMILVIMSGALGRYLFTLSSILLHKQYAEIRNSEPDVFTMIQRYDCVRAIIIRKRLSKFALHCFRAPQDVREYFIKWVSVAYYGAYFYILSSRDLEKIITSIEILANLTDPGIKQLKKDQIRKLRSYILHIVKMGYNNLAENTLRHWRVLHVPFLYILAITATAHVIAVHMY